MRKFFTAVFFVAAIVASAPAHAYFCWGDDSRDPRDVMRDADVVFTGTVEKLESMGISPDELKTERTNIVFRLRRVWKGITAEDGQTLNADTEAFYEHDFKVGERYLVYGYRIYDGRISIIGCPRIHKVMESEKAIRQLGKAIFDYRQYEDIMAPDRAPQETVQQAPAEKLPAEKLPEIPEQAPAAAPDNAEQEPQASVPETIPAIPDAPAQMDEKSVESLLDTLQDETPAAAPAKAPAKEAPATPEQPHTPLDVIWEDAPAKPAAPVVTAPAEKQPEAPLDIIWDDTSGKQPATPAPAPTVEAPEAPVPPAPPAPEGETP